jgi:hypothetical protein
MFGFLVVVTLGGLWLGVRNQIITVLVLVSASLGVVLIKPIMASHIPFSGLFLGMCLMSIIWVIKDCLKPCFRIYRKLFSLDTVTTADVSVDDTSEVGADTDVAITAVDAVEDLEDASETEEDAETPNEEEQDADEFVEELLRPEDSQEEPDDLVSDDDDLNTEGDE